MLATQNLVDIIRLNRQLVQKYDLEWVAQNIKRKSMRFTSSSKFVEHMVKEYLNVYDTQWKHMNSIRLADLKTVKVVTDGKYSVEIEQAAN